jgi:hypothetical protein
MARLRMHLDASDPELFCLARLHRFASMVGTADALPRPAWRVLARHATLAAYRDCVALGLEEVAREVLRRALVGASARSGR